MESKLRKLLDITYELEGLMHLALTRDSESADIMRLIIRKGEEIGNLAIALKAPEVTDSTGLENSSTDFGNPNNQDDSYILTEYAIEDSQEEEDGFKPDFTTENPEMDTAEIKEAKRGKLVFTINDRFRFRRQLFENSDANFNNTLALVASMDSYDEAEEYFLNDEGFDRDDEVVAEFLDIIKKYFK